MFNNNFLRVNLLTTLIKINVSMLYPNSWVWFSIWVLIEIGNNYQSGQITTKKIEKSKPTFFSLK